MPELAYDKNNCRVGIYLNMPNDIYKKSLLSEQKFFNKLSISQEELISFVNTYDFGNLDDLMPWSNIDNELKQLFNYLMFCSQEYNLYMPIKAMTEKIVNVFGVYFMSIEFDICNAFKALQMPEKLRREVSEKIHAYFYQLNKLMGEHFICCKAKKTTGSTRGYL